MSIPFSVGPPNATQRPPLGRIAQSASLQQVLEHLLGLLTSAGFTGAQTSLSQFS